MTIFCEKFGFMDDNVPGIVQQLTVDLSAMDVKKKKDVYDNIKSNFTAAAQKIYSN